MTATTQIHAIRTTTPKLTVGVVGLGYLGAVHAACMADLGHRVVGYDVDEAKIEALRRARAPIFEPGLEDLLARTHGENLLFTSDVVELKGADVVFPCVGTPGARASSRPTPATSSLPWSPWPGCFPARR